jgi:hypothetical protein
MELKKQNQVFAIVLLLTAALACNRFSNPTSNTQNQTENSNDKPAEVTKPKRDPNEKIFRGFISTAKGIQTIQMKLKRNGDQLTGSYYYIKIAKDISLKGSIDNQKKFKIEETSDGKVTGIFTGDWKESNDEYAVMLEGTWKKDAKGEENGFNAVEQVIEANRGDIQTKSRSEADKKKKITISANYPELKNFENDTEAINKSLASVVDKAIANFKSDLDCSELTNLECSLDINFDTTFADDDFVSIRFEMYEYSGGAHPNSYSLSHTYNLKSGKEIKLADLFKTNSNHLKKLSDYCYESLKKQLTKLAEGEPPDEEMLRGGTEPNDENYSGWNITKKGLLMSFDPYQVAAYAYGPQQVIIPYSVLKEIAREDGALANFVK